ncbi:hypothetical protein ACVMIX_005694 [Rhizobium leguminosarum]
MSLIRSGGFPCRSARSNRRHDEVMTMIDRHGIFSMGIAYRDAHVLAQP